MAEKPLNAAWRLIRGKYGVLSLIAACLAYLSWPLILVIGLALVLCIEVPLVTIAALAGLVGLVTGAVHRDWLGTVASIMGLSLVGLGAWLLTRAMNF